MAGTRNVRSWLKPATVMPAAAVMLLAACSSSPPEVDTSSDPRVLAEAMVADELASALDLGPLTAACEPPGTVAVGAIFGCTATTEDAEVIEVDGVINTEGRIQLTTSNVVSEDALPSFEREAAATLNTSVGSNFTAQSVDCGDAAVVLPADFVLDCALVMPASGDVYDLTLGITDLDGRRFSLLVGDAPRA